MKLATICYVQESNKTLLICSKKKADPRYNAKWNGLGGKIQEGETPIEGAIREVFEESGLIVKDPILHGEILFPKMAREKEDFYCYVYVFKGYEGDLKESKEGILEWVDTDKILDRPTWTSDRIFLPWVLQGKKFKATFTYAEDGKTILDHSVVFYDE